MWDTVNMQTQKVSKVPPFAGTWHAPFKHSDLTDENLDPPFVNVDNVVEIFFWSFVGLEQAFSRSSTTQLETKLEDAGTEINFNT